MGQLGETRQIDSVSLQQFTGLILTVNFSSAADTQKIVQDFYPVRGWSLSGKSNDYDPVGQIAYVRIYYDPIRW